MSYDVYLEPFTSDDPTAPGWLGNMTSNVAPMWQLALNGVPLKAFHRAPCVEAAGPLAAAVRRMEADPDTYRALNPPNGWGNYDGALRYLRTLAEACAANPACRIEVSH